MEASGEGDRGGESARPIRALLISHTCQSNVLGLPKAFALAAVGVDLCVLVPRWWHAYGSWRPAEPVAWSGHGPLPFRHEIRATRLTWVPGAASYLHSYPSLGELVSELQPDVIDVWEEPWSRVSVDALRARDRHVPQAAFVSETEQNIDKRLPMPFQGWRRRTLSACDWAIGRSEGAVEVLRRNGYGGPAEVVPNAFDPQVFRPARSQEERDDRRRDLGIVNGDFAVAFAGRLVPEKGVGDLLEAIKLAGDAGADSKGALRLLIAGDGPAKDDLRQQADQLGLDGSVTFLGQLDAAGLARLMSSADVVAVPSQTRPNWKEQFGRVIVEAKACGTAVIGCDSGAIPDVVGHGGVIVPEGSPQALADAIRRLADDPEGTREMGRRGLEQAVSTCTWEAVANRMVGIYRRAIARRQASGRLVPAQKRHQATTDVSPSVERAMT